MPAGLEGLKVVSFESRRAGEMAELIRRYGGEPILAPSMREVPLAENQQALDFFSKLQAGEFDLVILLTGVGTRTLVEVLTSRHSRQEVIAALGSVRLVARGPKPVAALKELGLKPAISIPEPNTWREIIATLESADSISGKAIAIQEYGAPNPELISGLRARGARVHAVRVYRWALPEDLTPLKAAIRTIHAGAADVALFTNATQVHHLFSVAGKEHVHGLHEALGRLLVASIGPVCSEALADFGVEPDLEPGHPKMGRLVSEVAERAKEILAAKRKERNH
ncbi:MAG TPA: uroporphyrinogen-III synthase [Candidatus Acidoferrales bacterium]|nr:uroporphyrinogen-III synthase [Candidatus Acidoferrales bacterium]